MYSPFYNRYITPVSTVSWQFAEWMIAQDGEIDDLDFMLFVYGVGQ